MGSWGRIQIILVHVKGCVTAKAGFSVRRHQEVFVHSGEQVAIGDIGLNHSQAKGGSGEICIACQVTVQLSLSQIRLVWRLEQITNESLTSSMESEEISMGSDLDSDLEEIKPDKKDKMISKTVGFSRDPSI